MTRGIRASPVMIVRQMVLGVPVIADTVWLQTGALVAGLIISLNLWGSKRSGLIRDPAKEIKDLQTCFNVLKESEKRCCSLDLMRPQCLLIAAASNAGGIRLAELGKLIFMLTKRYDINKISDMLNEASFLVNDYQITQNKRRRDSSQTLRQPMAPEYSQNNRSFPNPSMPAFPPNEYIPPSDAALGASDWDALLLQMGHIQPTLGPSLLPDVHQSNYNSISGLLLPMQQNSVLVPEDTVTDDPFSLWSDVPGAFR